jgi:predicted alpha/beta hydrolase family esterase
MVKTSNMNKHVLFIHGAGEGAFIEDKLLTKSLQNELGLDYDVRYPAMPDEANAPYDLWKWNIEKELGIMGKPVFLVGHSVGASYLAKILTEIEVTPLIAGIFFLSAPFWGGKGWLYEGYEELELPKDLATRFPTKAGVFLYHTRDDEIVPFSHLDLYKRLLPQAIAREINNGGHQLNNDLSLVAKDIKSLKNGK